MGKLYCILGRSGSGKSSICDKVVSEMSVKKVITDTTRPMRDGEVCGVDYNFISIEGFIDKLSKGEYIAPRTFNEWKYATDYRQIDLLSSDYIIVIDPNGYYDFVQAFGRENVKGILLIVDEKDLLRRVIARDSDMKEVARRFLADEEDFREALNDKNIYKVENNNGCEWVTVGIISALIKHNFDTTKLYDINTEKEVE
jgi:guanylate kinase